MSAIIDSPLKYLLHEQAQAQTLLLLVTIFGSFLIPITGLLFFFSDSSIRLQPLFILNLCAIALGIVQQWIYVVVIVNSILLRDVASWLVTAIVVLDFLVPISVQCILIFRVVTVYKPHLMDRRICIAVYTPIVLLKLARITNMCWGVPILHHRIGISPSAVDGIQAVWTTQWVKTEWFLQLFDDVYVSSLFLYKVYTSVSFNKQPGVESTSSVGAKHSYKARLQALFWSAVSSFVFPVVFNIALLILVFQDQDFFHGAYIIISNAYVTIICVLLATIWTSGQRKIADAMNAQPRPNIGAVQFSQSPHRTPPTTTLTFILGDEDDEMAPWPGIEGRDENVPLSPSITEEGKVYRLDTPPANVADSRVSLSAGGSIFE